MNQLVTTAFVAALLILTIPVDCHRRGSSSESSEQGSSFSTSNRRPSWSYTWKYQIPSSSSSIQDKVTSLSSKYSSLVSKLSSITVAPKCSTEMTEVEVPKDKTLVLGAYYFARCGRSRNCGWNLKAADGETIEVSCCTKYLSSSSSVQFDGNKLAGKTVSKSNTAQLSIQFGQTRCINKIYCKAKTVPTAEDPTTTTSASSSNEIPSEPTDANNPVTDANDPVTDANEPVTDANEPVTDANEPVTDANEPVTDANEPVTDANEPVTDANEPVTDAKPVTDAQSTKAQSSDTVANDPATPVFNPSETTDSYNVTAAY